MNHDRRILNPLDRMFDPKSIALIGASEKEGSVGRTILQNLLSGKASEIYPVNPNRKTILGVECYPGIGRLIIEPNFKYGEYGVVVHDDYQGRGPAFLSRGSFQQPERVAAVNLFLFRRREAQFV